MKPRREIKKQPPATDLENQILVEFVRLRPATSLLFLRLLLLGLAILFFLFLIGVFFNLLNATFGSSFTWFAQNRFFLLMTGVAIYMLIGFIIYKQWEGTVYTVYSDHFVFNRGWLARTQRTFKLQQFGGATVEQSLVGKMLGFGTIRLIYTGAVGTLTGGEYISDIGEPFANYQMILDLIRTQRVTLQ